MCFFCLAIAIEIVREERSRRKKQVNGSITSINEAKKRKKASRQDLGKHKTNVKKINKIYENRKRKKLRVEQEE